MTPCAVCERGVRGRVRRTLASLGRYTFVCPFAFVRLLETGNSTPSVRTEVYTEVHTEVQTHTPLASALALGSRPPRGRGWVVGGCPPRLKPPRTGRRGQAGTPRRSRGSRWYRRPSSSSSSADSRKRRGAQHGRYGATEPGAHASGAASPLAVARRHRRQLVHSTRRPTSSSRGAVLVPPASTAARRRSVPARPWTLAVQESSCRIAARRGRPAACEVPPSPSILPSAPTTPPPTPPAAAAVAHRPAARSAQRRRAAAARAHPHPPHTNTLTHIHAPIRIPTPTHTHTPHAAKLRLRPPCRPAAEARRLRRVLVWMSQVAATSRLLRMRAGA
eukprot:2073276-Prymnesium_polylepis.1